MEFFLAPFAVKDLHRKVRKDRKEKRAKQTRKRTAKTDFAENGVAQNYSATKKIRG